MYVDGEQTVDTVFNVVQTKVKSRFNSANRLE